MIIKIFIQPGCPSCPPVKELGEKLKEKINVEFYDVSKSEGLAEAAMYNIMSTPVMILLDNNKVVKTWLDAPSEKEILKLINK